MRRSLLVSAWVLVMFLISIQGERLALSKTPAEIEAEILKRAQGLPAKPGGFHDAGTPAANQGGLQMAQPNRPTNATPSSNVTTGAMCVFKKYCTTCHSGDPKTAKGGLGNILQPGTLSATYVEGAVPENTTLYTRMTKIPRMPPPGNPTPSAQEIEKVAAWIRAGAPAWDPNANCDAIGQGDQPAGPPITPENVVELVRADIANRNQAYGANLGQQQPNYRYFSFAHLKNSEQREFLDSYVAGFIRLINHLSNGDSVTPAERVDTEGLVYRVDLNKVKWTPELFKKVKDLDPYFNSDMIFKRGLLQKDQGTQQAVNWTIRAEVFLANASRGKLYSDFLGIGNKETDWAGPQKLAVDPAKELAALNTKEGGKKPVVAAGFVKSGTEAANRMVYRHTTADGRYYYRSSNTESNTGNNNILARPFGEIPGIANPEQNKLEVADHDIMIQNRFGLPIFVTVNNKGEKEEQANEQTGLKCMSCHTQGMIYTPDMVRAALEGRAHTLDDGTKIVTQRLFPGDEAWKKQLETDNKPFQDAIAAMNLPQGYKRDPLALRKFYGDPLNASVFRFEQEPISIRQAAAEAGKTVEQLTSEIRNNDKWSRELSGLMTRDPAGNWNGSVRRDLWVSFYEKIMTGGK